MIVFDLLFPRPSCVPAVSPLRPSLRAPTMAAAYFPRRAALLLVALAALLGGVGADCVSYGLDYANSGSYQIDKTSNDDFAFTSMFQGRVCRWEW